MCPGQGLGTLVERFEFPRGDCINACQRKVAKASRLVASTSRSLVSSRLTPPRTPGLYACATEGTGETDSMQEEDGFELPVPPLKTGGFSEQASSTPPAGKTSRNRGIRPERDRWFESVFLQRGVWCEPDFRGRIPSMTVGDFANANPSAALARGTERQRITPDQRADNCEPIIP